MSLAVSIPHDHAHALCACRNPSECSMRGMRSPHCRMSARVSDFKPKNTAKEMLKNDTVQDVSLPEDDKARTEYPMAMGLLDYFPNALAEVARLSHFATQQHHPDEEMHWARDKSTEHADKIIRHLVDRGKRDKRGMRHSAMVAWRALALLQEEIEFDEGLPPSRASRNRPDTPPPGIFHH